LPDPLARTLEQLVDRIRFLEAEVDRLRHHTEAPASVHPD
jgi:cell division protein FtsB